MALDITIFFILVIIALALFLFGASRESMKAGFIFILLSAVILIVTGLFVWTSGIQLNKVASIDTSLDVMPYTYETVQATVGSPLWVLSNIFVFGGIGLALLSFGLTVRQRRQDRAEAEAF